MMRVVRNGDFVGVVAERGLKWMAKENPEDYRRWCYTAVTRAKESLVVFEAP